MTERVKIPVQLEFELFTREEMEKMGLEIRDGFYDAAKNAIMGYVYQALVNELKKMITIGTVSDSVIAKSMSYLAVSIRSFTINSQDLDDLLEFKTPTVQLVEMMDMSPEEILERIFEDMHKDMERKQDKIAEALSFKEEECRCPVCRSRRAAEKMKQKFKIVEEDT